MSDADKDKDKHRSHRDSERSKKRKRSYSSSSDSSSSRSSSESDSRHKHKHKRRKHKEKHRSSKHKDKKPKIEEIDEDDYFRKSTEFREWLRDTQGVLAGALKKDEAMTHFQEFCDLWNDGKLPDRYYKGHIKETVTSRTHHHWNFKGVDAAQLSTVRRDVDASTNFGNKAAAFQAAADAAAARQSSGGQGGGLRLPANASGGKYDLVADDDEGDRLAEEAHRRKSEAKQHAKTQRAVLDELVPRESGRDARVDAKRYRSQSRREAEDDKMGGMADVVPEYEGDRLKTMLMKQEVDRRRKQEARASEFSERVAVARDKEDKTMDMLRQLARSSGYNVK